MYCILILDLFEKKKEVINVFYIILTVTPLLISVFHPCFIVPLELICTMSGYIVQNTMSL